MIDPDGIRRFAALAGLDLSDVEVDRLGRDLTAILAHVRTIDELDLSALAPPPTETTASAPLRDDEPVPAAGDAPPAGAAAAIGGMFIVPGARRG